MWPVFQENLLDLCPHPFQRSFAQLRYLHKINVTRFPRKSVRCVPAKSESLLINFELLNGTACNVVRVLCGVVRVTLHACLHIMWPVFLENLLNLDNLTWINVKNEYLRGFEPNRAVIVMRTVRCVPVMSCVWHSMFQQRAGWSLLMVTRVNSALSTVWVARKTSRSVTQIFLNWCHSSCRRLFLKCISVGQDFEYLDYLFLLYVWNRFPRHRFMCKRRTGYCVHLVDLCDLFNVTIF